MTLMIFGLCLLVLISLSAATPLSLYADAPTYPVDIEDYYCCLPVGPMKFIVIEQVQIDSESCDIAAVQATNWIGPACDPENITEYTVVGALSMNMTETFAGNTWRALSPIINDSIECTITVYESNPAPLGMTFLIISYVAVGISILACLWLFYRYYKTPRKPLSLHLIFVLSFSDFLFHVFSVAQSIDDSASGEILDLVSNYILSFSMGWSATMSIIIMKALSGSGLFRQLSLKTWIWCLLPSLVYAACVIVVPSYIELDFKTSPIWLYGTMILPIAITIFCYIKTVSTLRKNPTGMKSKDHALFLYPAVQLFLLLIVSSAILIIEDPNLSFRTKLIIDNIIEFFETLMGFFNALIYLIQKQKKVVVHQPNNEDSSESLLKANK